MAERTVNGELTIMANGYGILREQSRSIGVEGVFMSMELIRRFGLRTGDQVVCLAETPRLEPHYLSVQRIQLVNGRQPQCNA